MALGFEILDFKICELKPRELTVPRGVQRDPGGSRQPPPEVPPRHSPPSSLRAAHLRHRRRRPALTPVAGTSWGRLRALGHQRPPCPDCSAKTPALRPLPRHLAEQVCQTMGATQCFYNCRTFLAHLAAHCILACTGSSPYRFLILALQRNS